VRFAARPRIYLAHVGVSIDRLKEGGSGGNARRAVIINSLPSTPTLSYLSGLGTTAGLVGASIISNPWVRGMARHHYPVWLAADRSAENFDPLQRHAFLLKRKATRTARLVYFGNRLRGRLDAMHWPDLGGILGLAAASGGWRSGLTLSAFYSAGLAIPFLATGLGINKFLSFYSSFASTCTRWKSLLVWY